MVSPERQQPQAHISFFLPDLEMGGAERVFLTLSSALAQRGHMVELILARKSGSLLDEVDTGIAVIDLDARRAGDSSWRFGLRTVLRLARYLRRNPPDVLFSTLSGANLSAVVARMLSRRRFRLCVRESSSLANVNSRLRLWLIRLFYPLADRIIVLTDFMREQMRTRLHLPAKKMVVIGNPVDVAKLDRLSRDSKLISQAKKFQPYVVCVGRLAAPKDFATPIKAIARLGSSCALNLVLVGDGPLKHELQTLTRDLGVEKKVHFVGQQPNPYPWMAQAEAFVLSSRWEGYPNVLLEAEALNLPIVATEYDVSIKEILLEKQKVKTVDVGNDQAMAVAIQFVMNEARDPKKNTIKYSELERVVGAYEACIKGQQSCSMVQY